MNVFRVLLVSILAFFSIQIIATIIVRKFIVNFLGVSAPEVLEAYFVSIFTLPIVVWFSFFFSLGKSTTEKLRFLEVKSIKLKLTFNVCFVVIAFWFFTYFMNYTFVDIEKDFMFNTKQVMNNIGVASIVFISVCIAAPLVEELFFRGWLFKKLLTLNLDAKKILTLNTFLFMSIHLQYENLFSFFSIFCTGLLLSYIRLKSNNTSYSILAHSTFNFMSFSYLLINV